jgi:starvation-inducible DNA-binding protein
MTNSANTLATTKRARTRRSSLAEHASGNGTRTRSRASDPGHPDFSSRQAVFVQLLADTMTLRDLYAKHGEQAHGPLAKVFELICQRHRVEHVRLVNLLATHVRTLGGEPLMMAGDVSSHTQIPRPPRGREAMEVQIERLLHAHELIAQQAMALVRFCGVGPMNEPERDATVLMASELILTSKLHVWLLAEHLRHVSNASTAVARAACIAGRLVLPFS